MNLANVAARHAAAFPHSSGIERAAFLVACLSALNGPGALAQDALPFSIRSETMPNGSAMPPRGGYNGRMNRDQAQPPPYTSNLPGSYTANLDQGRPRGPSGRTIDQNGEENDPEFTPKQLASVVEVCLNGFAGQDAEGKSDNHNRAMRLLAGPIAARHKNGNGGYGNGRVVNGDRRMRSGSRGNARDRHPAQDAAIRALNSQGFFQRFPEARNIRLSSSWRD
jgi:hypothetical protein